MLIKDYELIYDIDILFQKKIVMYGAGIVGRRLLQFLEHMSLNVDCFCDKNQNLVECLNHAVISIDDLKAKTEKEDCLIIISSSDWYEEIAKDLEKKEISAFVCTAYGIKTCIELNIWDNRIPDHFRKDFMQRKRIYLKNQVMYSNSRECATLSLFPEAVIVYQPAKVGSSTITESLKNVGINSVHIHYFFNNTGIEMIDDAFIYFKDKLAKKAKIITLVREPVARALSLFMALFQEFVHDECGSYDLKTEAQTYVAKVLEENQEYEWFHRELQQLTGIDIYQYPFDKEQGYAWIKEQEVEILLLKLEKLDQNADLIGRFVGKPGINLIKTNIGSDKYSKYIYEKLKQEVKIDTKIVEKQYNEKEMKHFYTDAEITAFLDKWNNNTI